MNESSHIRRSKHCWYKVKDMAYHDMLTMENASYLVLNRFLGHLPCYGQMIQTINESYMLGLLGQTLELKFNKPLENNTIERYTIENYNELVTLVAAYHRFYMPAAVAMLLAG